MKYLSTCLSGMILLFALTGTANAAHIYADSIVDFGTSPMSEVTPISEFNSGGNTAYSSLTFPADGLKTSDKIGINLAGFDTVSGVLSSPFDGDFITVQMSASVPNVAGFDLLVVDREDGAWALKLAEVFVSTDGIGFTSVGNIFGTSGNDGSVDFGDFSGDVNYIKLQTINLQTTGLPPEAQIAIDAIIQHPAAVVPLPATAWLFGSGLLGLVGVARRRRS